MPRETLEDCAFVVRKARKSMSKELTSAKVKLALQRKTPADADRVYQPGDKVLVWHENQVENFVGEYVGPYTVISYDSITKTELVPSECGGKYEMYSSAQISPLITANFDTTSPDLIVIDYVKKIYSSLSNYKTPPDSTDICLIDVIQLRDPLARDPRMAKAIQE